MAAGLGALLLVAGAGVWLMATTGPADRAIALSLLGSSGQTTDADADRDERFRRLAVGTWRDFYQGKRTLELPRLRGAQLVRVDYRHVIWSLVRKPGAFARYKFREELFPSLTFRLAYDALVGWRGERADIEYVRILHLAASTMQGPVERALVEMLGRRERFDYAAVKALAAPEPVLVPEVKIGVVDLTVFDRMLGGAR